MILKAAKDFNIDLSRSYFIGDDKTDIQAGRAAGCKTILLNKLFNLLDAAILIEKWGI
jgi:histidinol phosphatase-like enzyme